MPSATCVATCPGARRGSWIRGSCTSMARATRSSTSRCRPKAAGRSTEPGRPRRRPDPAQHHWQPDGPPLRHPSPPCPGHNRRSGGPADASPHAPPHLRDHHARRRRRPPRRPDRRPARRSAQSATTAPATTSTDTPTTSWPPSWPPGPETHPAVLPRSRPTDSSYCFRNAPRAHQSNDGPSATTTAVETTSPMLQNVGWLTSRLMGSRFDGPAAIMAP